MLNTKASNGFTLIELMIALAIISILAVFALPAYQDYVIRAKLTDPFVIISGQKAAIYDHYSSKGEMPEHNSLLVNEIRTDLSKLSVVKTALSSSVSGDKSRLKLGFTIDNIGGSTGNAAKNTVYFEYKGSPAGIKILCSHSTGTTVDQNYLPAGCR